MRKLLRKATSLVLPAGLPDPVEARLPEGPPQRLEDLGVGAVYLRRLHGLGVFGTHQLLAHPAAAVADAMDVPEHVVATWQAMAELAHVPKIGIRSCEAPARAGIQGIDDLVRRDAREVAQTVRGHIAGLDLNVLGPAPGVRRVREWQKDAAALPRRVVRVRLGPDAPPEPIALTKPAPGP